MNAPRADVPRTRAFPAGAVLFREGDAGGEMFVIVRGRVRLTRRVRDVEKVLATLPAGEFFGEMALLNHRPRSATATMVEDAELLVVAPAELDALLRYDRDVAVRLVRRLARRLEDANEDLTILMFRDARSRVAYALQRFARSDGTRREQGVRIEMGTEAFARRVGLREEELLAELAWLRERGIVGRADEASVRLLDPPALERYLAYLDLHHEFGR